MKPSVTITSATPSTMSPPSTLPMNSNAGAEPIRSESSAWASSTSALPRWGSSPLESSPTRGRATPMTALASAAPMNANCTMCSRRASAFAPTSSSVTGCSGTGSGIASAGR